MLRRSRSIWPSLENLRRDVGTVLDAGLVHMGSAWYNTDRTGQDRVATMGITYIQGRVKGPRGKQAEVRFLVDSGATYTVLPRHVWKAIGLKPQRSMTFALADGTTVERSVSEAHLTLPQGRAHTPVILGEPDDQALLGVVTLEILGLVFNPFDRTLQPMRMLLA